MRTLDLKGHAELALSHMDAAATRSLQSFANGVNAFIENGAFLIGQQPCSPPSASSEFMWLKAARPVPAPHPACLPSPTTRTTQQRNA